MRANSLYFSYGRREIMENIMSTISNVNNAINGVVWGIPMLILIIGTGIYLTVGMKFSRLRILSTG